MREYGGDMHFVWLEVEALAKKQFSFKVFFITQSTLLSNNNISYTKFQSIQLQRDKSAEKCNESRKMLFIL